MKLCRACVHEVGGLCRRPIGGDVSLVDGKPTKRLDVLCENERKDGRTFWAGRLRCGVIARYFESAAYPSRYPPPPHRG